MTQSQSQARNSSRNRLSSTKNDDNLAETPINKKYRPAMFSQPGLSTSTPRQEEDSDTEDNELSDEHEPETKEKKETTTKKGKKAPNNNKSNNNKTRSNKNKEKNSLAKILMKLNSKLENNERNSTQK